MKAFVLPSFDVAARAQDLPEPDPGDGELLVRVHASSANPVDNAIVAGYLAQMVRHRFPVTLGRDFAGVVEYVGDGVSDFAVGDEVRLPHPRRRRRPPRRLGRAHRGRPGRFDGAKPPQGVGAARPVARRSLASRRCACVEGVEPAAGERVAVVGANGGVGAFAVQLAARPGATVIVVASPEDDEFLRRASARTSARPAGAAPGRDRRAHRPRLDRRGLAADVAPTAGGSPPRSTRPATARAQRT